MSTEYRELGPGIAPRKTKTPLRKADLTYDEAHYKATGEFRYYEFIDEEDLVDLGNEGEDVEKYWSEGWTTHFIDYRRSDYDAYEGRYYKVFPVRYRLKDHKLSKSLRRVLARNADLKTIFRPLRVTPKKEELYFQHVTSRFQRVPSPLSKVYEHHTTWGLSVYELSVFHPDGSLIALSIVQRGGRATYSDIAAWSVEHRERSLGTFTLLKEMEISRALGLGRHYVGHTFRANPSYRYKLRFGGAEIYDWESNLWLDANHPDVPAVMSQPLTTRLWDSETHDWAE